MINVQAFFGHILSYSDLCVSFLINQNKVFYLTQAICRNYGKNKKFLRFCLKKQGVQVAMVQY